MDVHNPLRINDHNLVSFCADGPLDQEWATFDRENTRLLADGQGGKFALIHGNLVVGCWKSSLEAINEGMRRFSTGQPFLVHQVQVREAAARAA